MNYSVPILTVILCLNCMPDKKHIEKTDAQSTILKLSIQKKANAIEHRLRTIQKDTVLPVNKDSIEVIVSVFEEWKVDYQQCNSNFEKSPDIQTWQALDLRLSGIGKRLHRWVPAVKNFGVFEPLKTPDAK
jgi:uncharacterized protein YpbB